MDRNSNLPSTQSTRRFAPTGRWWRFSEYQVSDGRIGPKPGAEFTQVDPWMLKSRAVGANWVLPVPYLDFLQLASDLRSDPPCARATTEIEPPFHLSAGMCDAVLRWCARYGLIGILPMHAHLAFTAQINVPNGRFVYLTTPLASARVTLADRPDDFVIAPTAPSTGSEWATPGSLPSVPLWLGNPVVRDGWDAEAAASILRLSNQVVLDMISDWTYPERPDEIAGRTSIGSEEYWKRYREPVEVFAVIASRFLQAVEDVNADMTSDDHCAADRVTRAFDYLSALADTTGRRCVSDGVRHQFREFQTAPSLLAYFAQMVLSDLKRDRRIFRCSTCSRVVVSHDSRARYCSARCRKTALMRTYRTRKANRDGE